MCRIGKVVTFWRYEVLNKHHTEGSVKATPPVFRYNVYLTQIEYVFPKTEKSVRIQNSTIVL